MKNKVMVVGEHQQELIWNMKNEKEIPLTNSVYYEIHRYINLDVWKNKYWELYVEWLEKDDPNLYNIDNVVNTEMIEALMRYNRGSANNTLYFWFDVDRNIDPEYEWKECPITKETLIRLPGSYHANNKLISPKMPLVFPGR